MEHALAAAVSVIETAGTAALGVLRESIERALLRSAAAVNGGWRWVRGDDYGTIDDLRRSQRRALIGRAVR